jgi:hypothetical protein
VTSMGKPMPTSDQPGGQAFPRIGFTTKGFAQNSKMAAQKPSELS